MLYPYTLYILSIHTVGTQTHHGASRLALNPLCLTLLLMSWCTGHPLGLLPTSL
jgi:hypothetical protein